jgi:hypothetical protein
MYTPNKMMEDFKLHYSVSDGARFTHTKIDKLPNLTYNFGIDGNWSAIDYRIRNTIDEAFRWFNTYWELQYADKKNETNQVVYERELKKEIIDAIERVNNNWMKKVHVDFENTFEDKLVKFIKNDN